MARARRVLRLGMAFLCGLPAGCMVLRPGDPPSHAAARQPSPPAVGASRIQVVAYRPGQEPPAAAPADAAAPTEAAPFAGAAELSADAIVQVVLARNPSVAEMVAAWKAAQDRYPQVTSLDDPMFGAAVAPAAFGSNTIDGGWRLEISQKYPWCGKLALRGANAQAEARAAGDDVEDTRLQLVESAKTAFFDYYLVERALDVNAEAQRLLHDFRGDAEERYKNGLVPQQDVFQADVEIGQQQERQVTLERMREVAVARLNTLMHLPPDAPLPPPPKEYAPAGTPPETQALREAALARRPDLKALADRLAADEAAVALARKEYGPDVEVMAAYDTFWQEKQLQPQVAVRLNLPVRLSRRCAAVAEAEERVAQRQAELARRTDEVNLQVQEAAAQVRESGRVVRLYEQKILPAARENVEAARAAYVGGKIPFLSLIEAQRNLVGLRDRYFEAVAAYGQRLATLERVTGGPTGPAPTAAENAPAARP